MKNNGSLRAIVICAGKSEVDVFTNIKRPLKITIEVVSDKNGRKGYQIESLGNILENVHFKSKKNFLNEYSNIEIRNKNIVNFKIFTIMDCDDCDESVITKYKVGELFRKYWFSDLIVPIYNVRNLEDIMQKAGFIEEAKEKKYSKVMLWKPDSSEVDQILNFEEKLKQNPDTNMEEVVRYCLMLRDY